MKATLCCGSTSKPLVCGRPNMMRTCTMMVSCHVVFATQRTQPTEDDERSN